MDEPSRSPRGAAGVRPHAWLPANPLADLDPAELDAALSLQVETDGSAVLDDAGRTVPLNPFAHLQADEVDTVLGSAERWWPWYRDAAVCTWSVSELPAALADLIDEEKPPAPLAAEVSRRRISPVWGLVLGVAVGYAAGVLHLDQVLSRVATTRMSCTASAVTGALATPPPSGRASFGARGAVDLVAEPQSGSASAQRSFASMRLPPSDAAPTRQPAAATEMGSATAFAQQWPVEATGVTSTFGGRIHPLSGQQSFHTGVDLEAPLGEAVRAGASGIVPAPPGSQATGAVR